MGLCTGALEAGAIRRSRERSAFAVLVLSSCSVDCCGAWLCVSVCLRVGASGQGLCDPTKKSSPLASLGLRARARTPPQKSKVCNARHPRLGPHRPWCARLLLHMVWRRLPRDGIGRQAAYCVHSQCMRATNHVQMEYRSMCAMSMYDICLAAIELCRPCFCSGVASSVAPAEA